MSDKIVWQGRHLQVVMRGTYECVQRRGISGIVGIIAVTDAGKLILVEQYRPPVQARVIELPAGLVGDGAGDKNESIETAARRELLEETGYEAREIVPIAYGAASAGLSDEVIHLVLARGLAKAGEGGGDEHEDITSHEVLIEMLPEWLRRRQAEGIVIDLKVWHAHAHCTCPR